MWRIGHTTQWQIASRLFQSRLVAYSIPLSCITTALNKPWISAVIGRMTLRPFVRRKWDLPSKYHPYVHFTGLIVDPDHRCTRSRTLESKLLASYFGNVVQLPLGVWKGTFRWHGYHFTFGFSVSCKKQSIFIVLMQVRPRLTSRGDYGGVGTSSPRPSDVIGPLLPSLNHMPELLNW